MKKFMKGSAIAGLVCLLVGVVIFAIGALGGGMKYMNKSNTTPLQNIVHLAKDFGVVEISGMNISFGTDTINNKIFDNNQEKYEAGEYTFEDVKGEDLKIVVGAGQLQVKTYSEECIKLEIGKEDKMQCFAEDNCITVIGGTFKNSSDSTMVLYLPENAVYNEVLVEVGAGSVDVNGMSAKEAEFKVGMGCIIAENIAVDSLKTEVGMGEIIFSGSADEDVNVDCGMGNVTMTFDGKSDEYNYELKCGMGALSVEDVYYIAGIGEQDIDNGMEKEMEISCAMGNVEVKFSE